MGRAGGGAGGGFHDPFDLFREVFSGGRSGGGGGGGIFDDFFGGGMGGGATAGAQQGNDLRYDLEITLEEAAEGIEKEIKYRHYVPCTRCEGEGAEPGTKKVTCSSCQGHGQVTMSKGFFSVRQTCPSCRGAGVTFEKRAKKAVASSENLLSRPILGLSLVTLAILCVVAFIDYNPHQNSWIGGESQASAVGAVNLVGTVGATLTFGFNYLAGLALQMITNPVTIIPIYTLCYEVGHHAFNLIGFHVETFSLSEVYAAITGNAMGEDTRRVIKIIFQKTLFGGVILGSICGLLSSLFYTTITRKFLFPKKAKPEDELNQTL
jgi:hypothetical protein